VEIDPVKTSGQGKQVVGELRLRTILSWRCKIHDTFERCLVDICHHPSTTIIMFFSMLSARSIASISSTFSKTWVRCIGTVPESARPPGPIKSWSRDERNAWRRWRYANDIKYRESMKKANNDRNHRRVLQGIRVKPEYREAQSRYHKDRYAKDPDYRQAIRETRARWSAVPENRKAVAQRHKERYLTDQEYRERMKQHARERYWKIKFGLATDGSGRPRAQEIPDASIKSEEPEAKP
jgi:hypothetical protein